MTIESNGDLFQHSFVFFIQLYSYIGIRSYVWVSYPQVLAYFIYTNCDYIQAHVLPMNMPTL